MSTKGDLNGDQITDAIFASGNTRVDRSYDAGAVHVIMGAETVREPEIPTTAFNGQNGFSILGSSKDHLGSSVATGDLNGDGIDDLIVGARYQTFVVFGSQAFPTRGLHAVSEVVDIPKGETVTYHLTGSIPAMHAGAIFGTARALVTVADADLSNNTASSAETVILPAKPRNDAFVADIDGNGEIAFADFLILSAHFGRQDASRDHGDLDEDGRVTLTDFLILSVNFGASAFPRVEARINP